MNKKGKMANIETSTKDILILSYLLFTEQIKNISKAHQHPHSNCRAPANPVIPGPNTPLFRFVNICNWGSPVATQFYFSQASYQYWNTYRSGACN